MQCHISSGSQVIFKYIHFQAAKRTVLIWFQLRTYLNYLSTWWKLSKAKSRIQYSNIKIQIMMNFNFTTLYLSPTILTNFCLQDKILHVWLKCASSMESYYLIFQWQYLCLPKMEWQLGQLSMMKYQIKLAWYNGQLYSNIWALFG